MTPFDVVALILVVAGLACLLIASFAKRPPARPSLFPLGVALVVLAYIALTA